MTAPEPVLLRFAGPFGVEVELRQSAGLLAMVFLLMALLQGGTLPVALGLVAVLMGSVLLHEAGHVWGARVQGIAVARVVLHGGGGFTETGPAAPDQQGLILAMGPIVNLAIWALCGLAVSGFADNALGNPALARLGFALLPWLSFAGFVNLAFFLFNMVPVQPLDGGRLLLLALGRRLPQARALRLAGGVGVVFSLLWWPALVFVFATTGWLILFAPSLALHLAMARGQAAPKG